MSRRTKKSAIAFVKFSGLDSNRYRLDETHVSVRGFVRHNDVAINYVERGFTRVQWAAGDAYELRPGQLSFLWGAVPHKVEAFDPRTIMHGLVLPVQTFLQWAMPASFSNQLLRGRVFFEPDAKEGPRDLILLNRWHREVASGEPEALKIVLLELEGRLRRLARACAASPRAPRIPSRESASHAERMLLVVADHFQEQLLPRDVAAAVGLDPDYAGSLFRHRMGMGLNDYITECRVSHAKALLATTDAQVLDVATDSGFGSVSQFHHVFKRLCGFTPRAYRVSLRGSS